MTEKEQDDSIEIDDSLIKLLPQMIANSVGIAKYYRSFMNGWLQRDLARNRR